MCAERDISLSVTNEHLLQRRQSKDGAGDARVWVVEVVSSSESLSSSDCDSNDAGPETCN